MKNNFITKIIGATLAFAMMIGVGVSNTKQTQEVHADDAEYTITFANNASSATAISANTNASTAIAAASTSYVTSKPFSNISGKVYYGDTKTCIRLGKSGESSSITIALSNSYNYSSGEKEYSKISVLCDKMAGNKNANAKLSVNGLTAQATPANGSAAAVEFNLTTTNIDSFTLSGDAAIYVYSVTLTEKSEGPASTVDTVSASIKSGNYYAGNKLSYSDFNVIVSWTGDKADTNPTSGFTWTVNGVADGELEEGDNTVVLTYQEVSSQPFVVTATVEPGTVQNNPLSVADAVAKGNTLSAGNETTKTYFIQGVVSEVITNTLDEENGFATFWMQNGNTAHGFEAYQITAADGCTNYSDLRVGAEVLLTCKIYRYNASTIETGTGKSLLSISSTTPTLAGIVLNKTSLKLEAGKFETLTASPDPVGAELGDVTWESSNENVATVNGSGKVTGVYAGSATITASAGGFTATCNVVVELCATLDLTTTTALSSASEDLLTWSVADKLSLRIDKNTSSTNANNYYPGKSNYTSTRVYNGQIITLTPDSNLVGVRVEFVAKSNTYAKALKNSSFTNAAATLPDGNEAVVVTATFTDGMKPIVINVTGTCGFDCIKLFYTEKTARQQVETNLSTQTQLSYRYTGNAQDGFAYSDISIRFGANITKALWNELDTNEHVISGFGVIIADGDLVTNATDMADAMGDVVLSTVTPTFTQDVYAIDYFVPVANMDSVIGDDGDNYFWNLRWAIDEANMDKMYSAVAYIKVGDEYVLMNMARESVATLAQDYLDNRGCTASTAEGSLKAIVDNA